MRTKRHVVAAVATVGLLLAAGYTYVAKAEASSTAPQDNSKGESRDLRGAFALFSTTRGSSRMVYGQRIANSSDDSGFATITALDEIDATSITYTVRSLPGASTPLIYNVFISLPSSSVYPANGTLVSPGNLTLEFNPPLRLRSNDTVWLLRARGSVVEPTSLEVYIHGFVPGAARMDGVSVH